MEQSAPDTPGDLDRSAAPADGDEMRLDELAAAAGVASTTVRLYQQRGLLPGPRLVGRTGWYGAHHLERLRLIARLQRDGFSLAGIGRLLDAADRGGDLTDLVGATAGLDSIRGRAQPVEVEPRELLARFGAEALDPAVLARAVASGLVEGTDDGRLRVPDRRFLEVGSELVSLGVPAAVVVDEWDGLTGTATEIARRFVAVFEREVLGPDWRDHVGPELAARAGDTLPRLVRLAHEVVDAALDAALAREIEVRLDDLRDLVPELGPSADGTDAASPS